MNSDPPFDAEKLDSRFFFGVLFAPTILGIITAIATGHPNEIEWLVVIFASIAAGPICATHLVKKSLTPLDAPFLWILTSIVCMFGALGLALGGCSIIMSN